LQAWLLSYAYLDNIILIVRMFLTSYVQYCCFIITIHVEHVKYRRKPMKMVLIHISNEALVKPLHDKRYGYCSWVFKTIIWLSCWHWKLFKNCPEKMSDLTNGNKKMLCKFYIFTNSFLDYHLSLWHSHVSSSFPRFPQKLSRLFFVEITCNCLINLINHSDRTMKCRLT
jgi:hypothetical protein